MSETSPIDLEPLLATVAELFANEGRPVEVAILARADASLSFVEEMIDLSGGAEVGRYRLTLHIPWSLYAQVSTKRKEYEQSILGRGQPLPVDAADGIWIMSVFITILQVATESWRQRSLDWVSGKGV